MATTEVFRVDDIVNIETEPTPNDDEAANEILLQAHELIMYISATRV